MDTLEQRVRALPCWQGPATLEPLKGGLTNISFVVTDGGTKYVVRCGDDIAVHHIFRDRERAAGRAAFEAGLSPEIVHTEPGLTVMRFIAGRTLSESDMRADIPRLVELLDACHREVGRRVRGPANVFWPFHVIRDYARLLDAESKYAPLADKLERAQVPMPIVFGHHDLLPGNLMNDGNRLWLIDWEYGAFGTPMFDLANLSSNGSFAPGDDDVLLDVYFKGRVTAELQKAFAAMKAASALREALWALVSDKHLRTEGVDYQAHAREYLARFDRLGSCVG